VVEDVVEWQWANDHHANSRLLTEHVQQRLGGNTEVALVCVGAAHVADDRPVTRTGSPKRTLRRLDHRERRHVRSDGSVLAVLSSPPSERLRARYDRVTALERPAVSMQPFLVEPRLLFREILERCDIAQRIDVKHEIVRVEHDLLPGLARAAPQLFHVRAPSNSMKHHELVALECLEQVSFAVADDRRGSASKPDLLRLVLAPVAHRDLRRPRYEKDGRTWWRLHPFPTTVPHR